MTHDDSRRSGGRGGRRPRGSGASGLRSLRGRFAVRSRREERGLPYVDGGGGGETPGGDVVGAEQGSAETGARRAAPISSYASDPPARSTSRRTGRPKRGSTPVGRREEADVGPGWYLSRVVGWLAVAVVSLAGGALIPVIFATGPLTLLETKLTDSVYVYERPVVGAIGLAVIAPLLGGIICIPLVAAPAAALGRAALAVLALWRSVGARGPEAVTFSRKPGPRGLVPARRTRTSDALLRFTLGSWSGEVTGASWVIATALLYAIGIVRWPVTSPVLLAVLGVVPLTLAGWGLLRAVRGWRRGGDVPLQRLYA